MAAGDLALQDAVAWSWLDGNANGYYTANMPPDLDADTLRLCLLTSTHTPDTTSDSAQKYWSNALANEATTGTAYTASGANTVIDTSDVTETAANSGIFQWDAADEVIAQDAGGGFTNAYYINIIKWVTATTDSPILVQGDMGANKSNTTGSLTIQWNTNGILRVTVSNPI